MARRPGGPEQVEKLEGSAEAKKRLRIILETVAGTRTVEDACGALAVGPARFHDLRDEVLAAALQRLEPRPAGRPPKPVPEPNELDRIRQENLDLRIDLEASRIREEIAVAMPHLLRPRETAVKKTNPAGAPPEPSGRKRGT